MTFDIYPDGQPLALPPAVRSDPLKLTPRFDPQHITTPWTIRLVSVGQPTPSPPTFEISVGNGPLTLIDQVNPTALKTADNPDTPVASVSFHAEPDSVACLQIFRREGQPAGTLAWALRLTNPDPAARVYRWVGADNDVESKQAFVTVDATTKLDVLAGKPKSGTVGVANGGTGSLTVTTPAGTDLGSGFTLTAVPTPIAPNARGEITVTYEPPTGLPRGATAIASTSYTFATNDPVAGLPSHTEARATLTATTRGPLWMPGDILVTDPLASDGVAQGALIAIDPTMGRQTIVSAGQRFAALAGVALDAQGDALVVDPTSTDGRGAIYRVDRFTGEQTVLASAGLFQDPTSLVVTPAGGIVVVDPGAFGGIGGLITVDPATNGQTKLASGGPLLRPLMAVLDPQTASLVVLNSVLPPSGNWLATVDPQGNVTPFTTAPMRGQGAAGIALDDSGRALLALQDSSLVAVPPGGGPTSISEGQLMGSPHRLHRDGADNVLVVDWGTVTDPDTTPDGGKVIHIRLSDGRQTQLSGAGLLRHPFDLVVVPGQP
jgi:hypothetical protein